MEKTRNEGYGFYGTMSGDGGADEAWAVAMQFIIAETAAAADEVRAFLDSCWGRHFADTLRCRMRTNPLREAMLETIREWNSRKLSLRQRRELGIPMPMPYLNGMVYAASCND